MLSDSVLPIIAFVWRPADIKSAVVQAVRSTGSRAIFDVSAAELDRLGPALLKADAGSDAVELKISPAVLMRDDLAELLDEIGITRVWVELHPRVVQGDPRQYLQRIEELSDKLAIIPIMGDPGLVSQAMDEFRLRSFALKGSEAGGFVSGETIFTVYASMRQKLHDRGDAADLFVWGGIASPEAAAAFLSAGAAGIIFESLHWLTDLAGLDDEMRHRISKLQPDHTDLTGLNLNVPCRLFNKGNSKAVKELKDFAGSLCGSEIRDEQRTFFASRIQTEAVHPLDSKFGREELIPLGVEATFAESFVRRFGSSTEEAIDGFIGAIETLCAAAADKERAFVDSPIAAEMGTRYPFVQGAMSWITDVPEFARAVADAGALPTVALGLMDANVLEEKLGRLTEVMSGRPYAVNVITLPENPHRDAQLAWIKKTRPRFAVIAAGEPAHAAELVADGIDVIYIAPTEQLLKMALEAGIHYVICEGHEAGGHVGQHSTLTLAQMVIDLKDRETSLFEGSKLILAGGVFNRETSFMASMLGADAVQMGTVYLTTAEIVETRALTNTYQRMILQSDLAGTVITGEATGLRVRSLKSPRIEAVCDLEREFASGSEPEASFRHKIEALTAGSLLVAARGTLTPGGEPLDEATRVEQGQFMSGACAGALKRVMTLEELHRYVAESSLAAGLPFLGPIRESESEPMMEAATPAARDRAARSSRPTAVPLHGGIERIAVTGISIANSLGNSPEEVWAASLGLKSGIVEVPPSRWNHELFYDPRPRAPEKTYCKVGAFMNLEVSRKDIGVPPQDFRTMTGSTKMTMWLAGTAIDQSGILESEIPRDRIAVIVSQNSGEAAATLQDVIIRGSVDKIVSSMKKIVDLTPENQKAVEEEIKAGRIAIDDTTLLGRLNCTAGGFICNKYGFMGPSWSVSAACATALVAMYNAVQMIRNGVIDAAIIGGAEELLTPMHFLEFSALGALAGISGAERSPSEASRPFDRDRDGMVLGEGGGFIVIERESLAKKRGARVHAYITSMGASNNHLGMVESSRITQQMAIRASFPKDYYGPEEVDVIECHATSTLQGDVEEVQALREFFNGGRNRPAVLTSFKSQIGHTLGASGINSLIRGIMAMNAGIFPPTLNYTTPDPEMELNGSNLTIHPQPADWPLRDGQPRRLQVNAFGFGGSNYVVQVEQAIEDQDIVMVSLAAPRDSEPQMAAAPQKFEGISLFSTEIGGSPYRLAVVAPTEQEAISLVERAEPFTNGGPIARKRIKALARQGLHLGPESSSVPPLSFVFPGQGSHYAGMSRELYETFPVIREWMDRAQEVAEFDLLHLLFYDREEDLQKTRWQQPALFTMEYAMVQYFVSLGITPKALAGHSLGELTAMCLAGVYSFEDGFRLVNKRALCMDKACEMNVDPGIMMAVDAPMSVIEEKLAQNEGVYVTNLNSPHQIVIGGDTEKVKALGEELKQEGHRRTQLRVSMAFHSPIMRCIHDELEEFISGLEFHPPKIPVISNTTTKPYPDDTAEIKRIVMAHLESPVHWMHNVRTLWNDYGVRLFVEVGPRDVLSNMIQDTIEEADCIQTSLPSAEALIYRTAMAQLYVAGHLRVSEKPRFVSFPKSVKTAESALPAKTSAKSTPVPAAPASIDRIIQREVNAFVVESFGRFLKPAILAAIRKEHDPNFTEERLNQLFSQTLSISDSALSVMDAALVQRSVAPPPVSSAQVTSAAPVSEAIPQASPTEDITETVIRIIMDATGYERDEIEPDMDLREDLSIRSSRLPVIMDAVEGQFAIKIELEQFMDVRTIRDISNRISAILEKKSAKGPSAKAEALKAEIAPAPALDTLEGKQSLKRVVFREVPSESSQVQPVELQPGDSVVVLSAEGGTGLRQSVGGVFRRDYGAHIIPMTFMDGALAVEDGGGDLRTDEGAASAARALGEVESLAGLVFVLDEVLESRVNNMEEITAILKGFFTVLKTFLESSSKKFVILLEKNEHASGRARLLAEGALGMFLSASHEFGSVQFRTVRISQEADLRDSLRAALDRSRKVLETSYRDGTTFTVEGSVAPAVFNDPPRMELSREDVVVFSGGAYGITPFVVQALVPFGCKMVFLGRTVIDRDPDGSAGQGEIAGNRKQVEILRTLERLRSSGIEAEYIGCDVTDAERTASVLADVQKRLGRIAGVIHAAGVLKDNFVRQMTPDDFVTVVDVKFRGAWNLFNAVDTSNLRFFVCFSSGAAIQGNPGQVNYAAGNRMMSALMNYLAPTNGSIRFKALMLAPIEGAGMAEDEEVRALMKRMNAEYLHTDELAGMLCQELFVAPAEDVWVLFMRSLPELSSVGLDSSEQPATIGTLRGAAIEFKAEDFPLIENVTRVDLEGGELEATRSFSQETDLWIPDHKPFKFMKYPLVSAIMGLETFMEAARMLYPYLTVYGIRDAQFLDIIECPPGVQRFSEIICRRANMDDGEISCEVSLATREISPSGRVTDHLFPNYKGIVILGAGECPRLNEAAGHAFAPVKLDSRPMDHAEVLEWYQGRTDLQGRYRVIEDLEGTSAGAIRGRIVYKQNNDFAPPRRANYQYSPYLLEALMQVVNFYIVMRNPDEQRSMIPFRIGEMLFARKCRDREEIILEARMKQQTDEGITWDARGLDSDGRIVMYAGDLVMRWFGK